MQSMSNAVPAVSGAQMQEIQQRLQADYHIDPRQTLENAGRSLAQMARRLLDNDILDRPIVVLVGNTNHGSRGMAAARHLLNWGADVQVLCTHAPTGDTEDLAAQQLQTLQAMGAPLAWAEEGWELPPCDLLLDALMDPDPSGVPQDEAHDLLQLANSSMAPILSLETPSGLDAETGASYNPGVQATATLALALPRQGLIADAARSVCGDLYLADIGVPAALYAEMGWEELPPFFAEDSVIVLQRANHALWAEIGD